MIRENGEIESEDEAALKDMPPLEDAPIGDEEFAADHGEISGMEVTTDGSRNGVHITPPTTEYSDDSSSSDEIPTDESGERLVDLCY